MGSREKLFAWGDAYDVEGTQQLFVDAVRENCAFHAAHCEAYGNVLQHMGFSPESLRTPQALAALPALPTVFFKKHEVYSMPRHRALIHATSSGTQGSMSHIAFEASGLWCGLHMVLRVARWRGLLSACPAHYIILGYQPHRGNHTAVTKTAYGATLFSPALSRTFALKYGETVTSRTWRAWCRPCCGMRAHAFLCASWGFPLTLILCSAKCGNRASVCSCRRAR